MIAILWVLLGFLVFMAALFVLYFLIQYSPHFINSYKKKKQVKEYLKTNVVDLSNSEESFDNLWKSVVFPRAQYIIDNDVESTLYFDEKMKEAVSSAYRTLVKEETQKMNNPNGVAFNLRDAILSNNVLKRKENTEKHKSDIPIDVYNRLLAIYSCSDVMDSLKPMPDNGYYQIIADTPDKKDIIGKPQDIADLKNKGIIDEKQLAKLAKVILLLDRKNNKGKSELKLSDIKVKQNA